MLHIQNLSVFCDKRLIAKNINLQILPKEKILLTGKSGIGKTLVAKELCEQRYQIIRHIKQDDIAFIPQHAEHSFNPLVTIGRHFEDVRLKRNLNKATFYAKVTEYFDFFALPLSCLSAYAFECSGGMLQRILIILVHCQAPKLIIADEPTAALDSQFIDKVFTFWDKACALGTAFFIVSHQIHQYEGFVHRMYELRDQQVQLYRKTHVPTPAIATHKIKGLVCCAVNGTAYRTKGFWRKTKYTALQVEQFRCTQGEIIGINGASGAGKTTFLKLLMGELEFEGQMILPRIQYMPQHYDDSLPAKWTVQQIIREAQQAAKCTKEACIELLEQVQLQPALLMQTVETLSGGQRQRLALFRVLLQKPQLLLLDEAFANLDDTSTNVISNMLATLAKEGLAIICVSHDEQWLATYTHRQYKVEHSTLKELHHEETIRLDDFISISANSL